MALVSDLSNNALGYFFQSVPKQSYRFEAEDIDPHHQIRLNSTDSDLVHCHRVPDRFEAFFARSASGNQIACLMIKPKETVAKLTILFSHGGTVDLGHLANYLFALGDRLGVNILAYDYSGFGQSTGTPGSEGAVYADAETAFDWLLTRYHLTPERVVLYGQSLGTAPSLHLATKFPTVAGLILHSPFLSAAKLASSEENSRFGDFFTNVTMISKALCPVLVMHGTEDQVVPIAHGKQLHELAGGKAVTPLWIEGAGHDDLYTFQSYARRLKRFINYDIAGASLS